MLTNTTKTMKNALSAATLGEASARVDRELKEELLALAKSGAPRPRKGTRLGDALIRFTTSPTKRTKNRSTLSEIDQLQIAVQKAYERESSRGRAIPRQRPSYLAKGQRRTD